MKIITILIIFLCQSALYASHPLLCDSPLKDFGIIEEGQKLSHTFIVKNVSSEPVEVDRIVSTCGCIVTSRKNFILSPNESTDIAIDFNSFGSGGMKLYKTIAVRIKDDKIPPLVLTVQAQIKGIPPEKRVIITPKEKTIENNTAKKSVLFLQLPAEPNVDFSIQAPEWLTYSLNKSKRNPVPQTDSWEIEISPKEKVNEKISGELIINSNVPMFEKLTATIQVVPEPAFVISPYMVVFDKTEPKQTQTVYIKSGEQQIESVYASIEIKPSKECLRVNWDKTVPAEEIQLEIANEDCDTRPARLEIFLNNGKVGIIPVIFR
jgi:hypothetical protein